MPAALLFVVLPCWDFFFTPGAEKAIMSHIDQLYERSSNVQKILLIATGGTIASTKTAQGLAPGITSQELYESVPEAAAFCTIDTVQLLNIDSTNVQPEQWLLMAKTIEDHYDAYDGFVITHGTDTMAYTAAALSYLIQHANKPIVLTGAQKPLLSAITDAKKNLLDALCFASQQQSGGVFVVFSGRVILGTRAKKLKTKSYEAFSSINYPEVALVDQGRIVQYMTFHDEKPVAFYHDMLPEVFLLKLIPGMDPGILDYIGEHYRAVVIESYGSGGLPFADQRNFLEKLQSLKERGCHVVVATQAMLEGSDLGVYEVGRKAMAAYDVMQAWDMTIEAVVTKLMWLLAQDLSYETLRQAFYTPVAQDILYTFDE